MCYTNILSRRVNLEFINLGFSGNGKGEPEVARIITTIDRPALFVLDYEANCNDYDRLTQTFPAFIRILRNAHPVVPMLAVSRIPFATEAWHPAAVEKRLRNRDFQKRIVEERRAEAIPMSTSSTVRISWAKGGRSAPSTACTRTIWGSCGSRTAWSRRSSGSWALCDCHLPTRVVR